MQSPQMAFQLDVFAVGVVPCSTALNRCLSCSS